MRILIIDDEPHIIRALTMLFEKAGYEVGATYNGIEGLAKLQATRPDVAIVDVMMPGLTGLEVLRAWKEQQPHADATQFLLLTASCDDTIAACVQGFENVQLVAKPFSPTKILRLAQELIKANTVRHEAV
jgi:CheY-like chemotaxis protein